MHRRQYLSLASAGVIGALAGCGGSSGSDRSTDSQSIDDHPALAGLESLPSQGTLDGHIVLAFEDPSCSRCKAFHDNTVPQLRSNIVEPGNGAFVFRSYPVVYPWGKPASQALASTYVRSSGAFWSLLGHYFGNQRQFNTDNVFDRTETFLNDATDLNGTAVIEDARNKANDDAVQANIAAAEDAGLGQTTPVVLLFRDGEFATMANGSVSYDLISETLEGN